MKNTELVKSIYNVCTKWKNNLAKITRLEFDYQKLEFADHKTENLTYLDPLDVVADDLDAGIGCERDTCRYNVHIDLACLRIRCRLLHGCADQADAFLDILLFDSVTEAHLGERFCDTDE